MTTLYLVPTLLADCSFHNVLPKNVVEVIHGINQFIAEDVRSARRFLSKIGHPKRIESLKFHVLNKYTKESELEEILSFISEEDTGLLSEAGVPGVADPGADIIRLMHEREEKVVPLVGPSSILMALMASGLNGQSFAFVGYLPIKTNERRERLRILEKRSLEEKQTQIFIETPYRNTQLINDIMISCRLSTFLTIAADITGEKEFIKTKTIKMWKKNLPELNKIPAVFLLQAFK